MEREKTKKVYFPEYAREFSNTQGPGPAVYLYEKVDNYNFEKNKKPKLGSMSRVSSHYFIFRLIVNFTLRRQIKEPLSMRAGIKK